MLCQYKVHSYQFIMRTRAWLFIYFLISFNKEIFTQCIGYVPSNMYSYYGLDPSHYNYKPRDCDGFNRQLKMESFNLPPPSINIASDGLVINGAVSVSGNLPFLSSVTIQGELPMIGSGIVEFSTGNDEVAIYQELPTYAKPYSPMSFY